MGQFLTSTRQDLVALQSLWTHADAVPHVVATVPPQHMYGMELSVLLPMVTTLAVHAGRPFFPDDVARALADIPAPRVLVTTPVHLRALVESGVALPPLAGIVSATAPLAPEIAAAAEARFGGEVRRCSAPPKPACSPCAAPRWKRRGRPCPACAWKPRLQARWCMRRIWPRRCCWPT